MRRYVLGADRVPIAVETDGPPNRDELEGELRRIYGVGLRVGAFIRRGKCRRAEVHGRDFGCQSYAKLRQKQGRERISPPGDWLGVTP
jgi:hypothetical protein